MLNKAIDRLIPNYPQLKNRTVFLWLSTLSFFLRFPFIFRDYIDRDESTFVLVGQGWVDGLLPYTELWDLKPPVTYLFFAALITIFGKSLIVIRLAGILVVAVIAFYTYKIGTEVRSKKLSFWAAFFTVFLISMFGSLQGVMSEHLSMLFFVPALYLIIKHQTGPYLFLAGLLMGAAAMTKLNLAYPILFLGLFLGYKSIISGKHPLSIFTVIVFGMGVLLTIGFTFLPYYLEDKSELWWNAVILAPLEYSAARRHEFTRFLPLIIFVLVTFFYGYWSKAIDLKNISLQILLVVIVGVVVAFLRGGRINGHYLIQLHPILIIIVFITGSAIKLKRWNYRPVLLFLLLLLPLESYKEYFEILKHKIDRGTFLNGEGYSVPLYVKANGLPQKNILFLEYHIGYWFLDCLPPTKAATHPTNLSRDETFIFFNNPRKSSMDELRFIMEDIAPEIIVTRNRWHIFDKLEVEENTYLRKYLNEHYKIRELIDQAEIHQRSK